MPPLIKDPINQPTKTGWTFQYFKQLLLDLTLNPRSIAKICLPLLLFEIVLNIVVIWKVSYTEIDWEAYMSEVEGFMNGTYDYSKLKGATGPLVYPAGFVYIYSLLYMITDSGRNILIAQYLFAILYLINLALVMNIYRKTAVVPPYVMIIICCTSYRIHSIYILRMFNDPVAMLFLYVAINFFIVDYWTSGCVFFSLAVSIKMNILLFAPALLILLLLRFGMIYTIPKLAVCATIQVVLAAPFLLNYPHAYLTRSFDFGRKFFFKWTVNWRFLSEEIFLNRWFHTVLLLIHVMVLTAFILRRWLRRNGGLKSILKIKTNERCELDANGIVSMLFICNFIGIVFSRSLHYQFYVWYYHTIPYLLWLANYPTIIRLFILFGIEMSWNTYPSTVISSVRLHICHMALLAALWECKPLQFGIRKKLS